MINLIRNRISPSTLTILFTILGISTWTLLLLRICTEVYPCYAYHFQLVIGIAYSFMLLSIFILYHKRRLPNNLWAWPLFMSLIYLAKINVDTIIGGGIAIISAISSVWIILYPSCKRWQYWGIIGDLIAFTSVLSIYYCTLAPSVLPGDSGEWQFVPVINGIPHPTGYPLYLLLGRLFALIPLGSVSYRLNLFSAIAAALAVLFVYRIMRVLGLRIIIALIAAALFGISETFWAQATIAEKYTLNVFFFAFTLWLGLSWRAAKLHDKSAWGWLYAWAFAYGLSLTHHRTMVLLIPAFFLLVLVTDRSVLCFPRIISLTFVGAMPLLIYGVLPVYSSFNPPYAYQAVDSVAGFFDLVFARSYQNHLFQGGFVTLSYRFIEALRLLSRQFTLLGLVSCVAGWLVLFRRDRIIALFFSASVLSVIGFALNYYVANTYVYYLPSYFIFAIFAGFFADHILEYIDKYSHNKYKPHFQVIWVVLCFALPFTLCATRFPGMDQRRVTKNQQFDAIYGAIGLRNTVDGGLIISDWGPATVLWYTQFIDGLAQTAQIHVVDSLETQWVNPVENALDANRPVYLARPVIGVSQRYPLGASGPLVRIFSEPQTKLPDPMYPISTTFEGNIRLLGYDLITTLDTLHQVEIMTPTLTHQIRGGVDLHLTLYWQALIESPGDYAVTLKIIDSAGNVRLERQNRHPVSNTYPTTFWSTNEVVADYVRLSLPPALETGIYNLEVAIGPPFTSRSLTEAGDTKVILSRLQLRKPLTWSYPDTTSPVRYAFGNKEVLIGYTAPYEVVPGDTAKLTLLWQMCNCEGENNTIEYPVPQIMLKSGEVVSGKPLFTISPEDRLPGAYVQQEYIFVIPDEFNCWVICDLEQSTNCFQIKPKLSYKQTLANFNNIITLRTANYNKLVLSPGELMQLTLEWEATAPIPSAYKVFVHILNSNDQIVAQQDNEPVNGTYPTTRWRVQERIYDSYAILLPESLPPGKYQVAVGLYLLSDFTRLPILDNDQQIIGDRIFINSLTVLNP